MVKDLNFTVISDVIDSWEALRRIPKYESVAGDLLFHSLFESCPDAMPLFGFPKSVNLDEIKNSRRFRMHSAYLIQMIDTALNMLGPDSELLTETMHSLGQKHARYGVTPDMFPAMGDALLETMEECLQKQSYNFNDRVKESWKEVYGALVGDMIFALNETTSK